jgi:hypothetical protein
VFDWTSVPRRRQSSAHLHHITFAKLSEGLAQLPEVKFSEAPNISLCINKEVPEVGTAIEQ